MATELLFAIFLPLMFVPVILLLAKTLKNNVAWLSFIPAIISAYLITTIGRSLDWSNSNVVSLPWVESLGVNLSFLVDGVSLFLVGCNSHWFICYFLCKKLSS